MLRGQELGPTTDCLGQGRGSRRSLCLKGNVGPNLWECSGVARCSDRVFLFGRGGKNGETELDELGQSTGPEETLFFLPGGGWCLEELPAWGAFYLLRNQ